MPSYKGPLIEEERVGNTANEQGKRENFSSFDIAPFLREGARPRRIESRLFRKQRELYVSQSLLELVRRIQLGLKNIRPVDPIFVEPSLQSHDDPSLHSFLITGVLVSQNCRFISKFCRFCV